VTRSGEVDEQCENQAHRRGQTGCIQRRAEAWQLERPGGPRKEVASSQRQDRQGRGSGQGNCRNQRWRTSVRSRAFESELSRGGQEKHAGSRRSPLPARRAISSHVWSVYAADSTKHFELAPPSSRHPPTGA
jgi:hypothetical protein